MQKKFILFLLTGCALGLLAAGCGDEDNPDNGDGTDLSSDENGSDTGEPLACEIDVLETFDTAIPTGWTVFSSGSGSGSNSGTGSGTTTTDADPERTWHHTSVETEDFPPAGMTGGYLFAGGFTGMNETLLLPIYDVGSCSTVDLTFTHFFDDFSRNENDRGEVSIAVDGPPWLLLATYNSNEDKTPKNEIIHLADYITGAEFFQLEFVFADSDGGNYGWAIDDVKITGAE